METTRFWACGSERHGDCVANEEGQPWRWQFKTAAEIVAHAKLPMAQQDKRRHWKPLEWDGMPNQIGTLAVTLLNKGEKMGYGLPDEARSGSV